jgi:hypothetical protein
MTATESAGVPPTQASAAAPASSIARGQCRRTSQQYREGLGELLQKLARPAQSLVVGEFVRPLYGQAVSRICTGESILGTAERRHQRGQRLSLIDPVAGDGVVVLVLWAGQLDGRVREGDRWGWRHCSTVVQPRRSRQGTRSHNTGAKGARRGRFGLSRSAVGPKSQ